MHAIFINTKYLLTDSRSTRHHEHFCFLSEAARTEMTGYRKSEELWTQKRVDHLVQGPVWGPVQGPMMRINF